MELGIKLTIPKVGMNSFKEILWQNNFLQLKKFQNILLPIKKIEECKQNKLRYEFY